jgi:uncharacterized protein (TIGR02118 family)
MCRLAPPWINRGSPVRLIRSSGQQDERALVCFENWLRGFLLSPEQHPSNSRVRNLTVLTRKPTLTREEFSQYWRDVHGPLVRQLPHVRRYSQNHVLESGSRTGYATGDYEIDGIVDFLFDSPADAERAFAGEPGRRAMADAANFIERMCVFTVEEHVIVDRSDPT